MVTVFAGSSVETLGQNNMTEAYISAEEAAKLMCCRPRHVTDLAASGQLIGYPIGFGSTRRMWRFKTSDIQKFLEDRRSVFTSASRTRIPARRQPSTSERN